MKKYLIKGALALFAGTILFSCAEKESEYVPLAQQKVKAFEDVFHEVYGDIDPYQTWGFNSGKITIDLNDPTQVMEVVDITEGEEDTNAQTRMMTRAMTRRIDVNGNEWLTTPLCTEAEANMVFNYVNMTRDQMKEAGHIYSDDTPGNFKEYFVTQVWTGTDKYSYTGSTSEDVLGSAHMDHLNIAMNTDARLDNGKLIGDWEHINNFNASSNMNYNGNTLVVEGGSCDFAYWCSEDSRYHHKWIAVNGADVDASLAGKYYICFDFIADSKVQTAWRAKFWNPKGNNGGEWEEKNFTIDGEYTVDELKQLSYTVKLTDRSSGTDVEYTYSLGDTQNVKDVSIDNYVNGNQKIAANDVYTDWIVRIVPASQKQPVDVIHEVYENLWKPEEAGRVFCEDLGQASREDLDYNDLVFDARIWSYKRKTIKWKWHYDDVNDSEPKTKTKVDSTISAPTYYADIKLIAAGGTIPITIANRQAHSLFVESADVATMINTRDNNSTAYGSYDTRNAVAIGDVSLGDEYKKFRTTDGEDFELWLIPGYSHIKDIPIVSSFNGKAVQELGADQGKAPHKIMVKYGSTKWTSERKNISDAYPGFSGYVTGVINNTGWVDNYNTQYLYSGAVIGENSPAPSAILSTRDVVGDVETILWTGFEALGNTWGYASLSSPYTMEDGFYPGDVIRFHGTVTAEGDNAPIITVSFADDSQPYLIENMQFAEKTESGSYPSEAYVGVVLDQSLCNRINNSKVNGQITLHVQGRGFTLTKIGFVPYKTTGQ
jgi:hypothetical protein